MAIQVSVIGSGAEHEESAETVGRLLAEQGATVVTGGLGEVMAAASRGAKSAGGTTITDAISFAAALLEQNHVAVVPGNDSGFDTHVRLSFATSLEQIDKGIDRIDQFLKKLG